MEYSPQIPIVFDTRESWAYQPGDSLSGNFYLDGINGDAISAVELSVLWQTEGKGNVDYGIHHIERRAVRKNDRSGDKETRWFDDSRGNSFNVRLPSSPLSYDGELIKIYWLVRVRVFMEDGRVYVDEHVFRLGDLTSLPLLRKGLEKTESASNGNGAPAEPEPPSEPVDAPAAESAAPRPETESPAND
ncbi:MAG: hypothetical protein K6E55_00875 [Thermoguttaceae bacterium]|nr:hypothetical protein [Thermoguttaceae bacterium]